MREPQLSRMFFSTVSEASCWVRVVVKLPVHSFNLIFIPLVLCRCMLMRTHTFTCIYNICMRASRFSNLHLNLCVKGGIEGWRETGRHTYISFAQTCKACFTHSKEPHRQYLPTRWDWFGFPTFSQHTKNGSRSSSETIPISGDYVTFGHLVCDVGHITVLQLSTSHHPRYGLGSALVSLPGK